MKSMAGNVKIRPLERTDESDWRRLWSDYLTFYQSTVSEEVYATTFERLLAGNGGAGNEYRGLIALDEGGPCGLAHFLYHRHCWRVDNVTYLQDLFVDPDRRGTGIGRKLIEAVYAAADEAGCPNVYWLTQEFNETGRRLYDRIGKVTPFIKYSRY